MSAPVAERFKLQEPTFSRRRILAFGGLSILFAASWGRLLRDPAGRDLGHERYFGSPVELDETGEPVVKIGRIIPVINEQNGPSYAVVRKAASQNSPELLPRIKFSDRLDNVEMIEVLGTTYPSTDGRGQKYKINGVPYGQWFQVTRSDNTPGHLSGNFITVRGIKGELLAVEPPY